MRSLLLALPLLLTLSACDSSSDGPITAVRVTGASLIDLDFTGPDGATWDGGLAGGPDVYLKFLINGVEIRNTQDDNDLDDIRDTDLPRTFEFGDPLALSNLAQSLTVEVWDDDGSTDQRIAAFTPLSIQTLATEEAATFNLTDGQTSVRLTLQYTR